jgi:mRNA interferase RelE/StbE
MNKNPPPTYVVEFISTAAKQLAKLPGEAQRRIARRIDALRANPRPPGAEALKGHADLWRVRVGDYRIIYQIENDRLVLVIVKLGHRREVYR